MDSGDLIRSRRRATAYYEEYGNIRAFIEYHTTMIFIERGIRALQMCKVLHNDLGTCWIEEDALEVLDETR